MTYCSFVRLPNLRSHPHYRTARTEGCMCHLSIGTHSRHKLKCSMYVNCHSRTHKMPGYPSNLQWGTDGKSHKKMIQNEQGNPTNYWHRMSREISQKMIQNEQGNPIKNIRQNEQGNPTKIWYRMSREIPQKNDAEWKGKSHKKY